MVLPHMPELKFSSDDSPTLTIDFRNNYNPIVSEGGPLRVRARYIRLAQ